MCTVIIDIEFEIGQQRAHRKSFEVNIEHNIRKLKEIALKHLEDMRLRIREEDAVNLCLARVDSRYRSVFFVSDPTPLSSLTTQNGVAIPLALLFTKRRRTEFPLCISTKKIRAINNCKMQQKFIDAMVSENIPKMMKILNKGLDPNFTIPKNNVSPSYEWLNVKPCLQEAVLNLLVENGLHLDYRNIDGECAVHLAIAKENRNAIKLLYFKGASFDEWNKAGMPALFYALNRDVHVTFLEYLLEFNPPLSATDISGNNSLHYCIKNGLPNHLSVILKRFPNNLSIHTFQKLVSHQNQSGSTPVHLCLIQNQKSCLFQLLKFDCCLEVINSAGETPLDLANRLFDAELIRILTRAKTGNLDELPPPRNFKTLTYNQSLLHCQDYAKGLAVPSSRSSKSSASSCLSYPPMLKAISSFVARFSDELTLYRDEVVVVYLILKTNVAFGYKIMDGRRIYGWFPCSVIGFTSEKKVLSFQKEVATFSALSSTIPELPTTDQSCNFIPIMLFVNLNQSQNSVGMEIGWKKRLISKDASTQSLTVTASPFYVRKVYPDSPAEHAGMQVGDNLLYIMTNEVSIFSLKTITSLLKKMCNSKVPQNVSRATIRQICFIVLRQTDVSRNSIMNCGDALSEIQSFCGSSGRTSTICCNSSMDLNPFFLDDKSHSSGVHTNISSAQNTVYQRPLPKLPPIESMYTQLKPQKLDNSLYSSLENLPPPPDY